MYMIKLTVNVDDFLPELFFFSAHMIVRPRLLSITS